MKHLLNNISEEEKNKIREQHTGGMKIATDKFKMLVETKQGDVKFYLNEQDAKTGQGKNFVEKYPNGNVEYKLPRIKSTDDLVSFVNWSRPHGSQTEAMKWLLDPKGGGLVLRGKDNKRVSGLDAYSQTNDAVSAGIWNLFSDAMNAVARTGMVGSASAYNGPEFRKVLRGITQGGVPGGNEGNRYDSESIINDYILGVDNQRGGFSSFGPALVKVVKAMG